MEKEKVYIGGSLFTDKQILQRKIEGGYIKKLFGCNYDIYNPIDNDEINDKTKQPTAKDIFEQDTNEILSSDIIIADLDDDDSGLAMELGIAYGVNYMLDLIEKSVKDGGIIDKEYFSKLIKLIPKKEVFAYASDIRQDTKNEEGIDKSWGMNQYVVGGVKSMGEIIRGLTPTLKNKHFIDAVVDVLVKQDRPLLQSDCK